VANVVCLHKPVEYIISVGEAVSVRPVPACAGFARNVALGVVPVCVRNSLTGRFGRVVLILSN
jgi:hypothetical protein